MADIEKKAAEAVDAKAAKLEKKAAAKAEAAKKAAEKAKADKPSLGSRIKNWFKGFKAEWGKIVWVTPSACLKNTLVVLVVVAVVAAILAILDYVFSTSIVGLGRLL